MGILEGTIVLLTIFSTSLEARCLTSGAGRALLPGRLQGRALSCLSNEGHIHRF